MADRVSWLQIEPGWNVVAADGGAIGTVTQVAGDPEHDIFDGLAVTTTGDPQVRYVPGEVVGAIFVGQVTLTIADTATLEPFEAAPPETVFRPDREKPSLTTRLSRWLGGNR